MSDVLYRALDAERVKVEASLADSATERTTMEQIALEERLKTLCELLDRPSRNDRARRLTQTLVVLAAGTILTLGLSLRLPKIRVQLDAKASGLIFTTAPASFEAREFANPERFDATSLLIRDASASVRVEHKATRVVGFVAYPETSIEVRAEGAGCFLFTVGSRKAPGDAPHGLSLTILDAILLTTASARSLPSPFPLAITAGESLHLCMGGLNTTLLLARVVNIEFWRQYSNVPPRILISTLTTGKLRIAETGEALELGVGDRLSLGRAQNGWLLLTSGETAGVTFAGTVGDAELVGVSPKNDRRVLRPSLAKYLAISPEVTWRWGALLGIVGAIWGMLRFFFPSS